MKREEKKSKIKKTIIDGLFSLLKDKQISTITSDEICKEASISRRTLYKYFNSKDEMYLALVKASFIHMNEELDSAVNNSDEINNSVKWISNIGLVYLKFIVANEVMGRLIIEYNEFGYIEQYAEEVDEIREVANRFELYKIFKEKELDDKKYSKQLALALWSHIQGLAQLILNKKEWLCFYYEQSLEEMIDSQITIIEEIYLK